MKLTRVMTVALAAAAASPLAAEDLALVIVNAEYDRVRDLDGNGLDQTFEDALEDAGFRVFAGADLTGPQMQRLAGEFAAAAGDSDEDDRIVVVLSGHLAGSAADGWLLGREVQVPNAFGVGAAALPFSPLAEIAARAPGQAVLMVADPEREVEVGAGLQGGTAPLPAPQGVTVAQGEIEGLLDFLRDGLLQPGMSYAEAIDEAGRDVTVSGYVSAASGLLPDEGAAPAPRPQPPREESTDTGEIAYWSAVRDIGTVEALRSYLERYPDGKFAADARRLIDDAVTAPQRRAEAAEAALELSRDQRRQIQRNLSLIGFDPRGIDGIFGPATRTAIGAWQKAKGFDATTFLTARQIQDIQTAANARAAELEREAAERRAAEERQDRAYWRDLGEGRDEAALRAYLKRYPDGIFSDVARDRLAQIEDDRAGQVRREVRQAWRGAQEADNIAAYQSFLERYPDTPFEDAARARIAELEDQNRNSAEVEQARQEETGVAGNTVTRLLVERRLQQIGFDPGAVDGAFDEAARRAIRRFQRDQGVPITGYVTRETMVRLLAMR